MPAKGKKQHWEPFHHKEARVEPEEEQVNNQQSEQQTQATPQTEAGITPAAGVTPLATPPPGGALLRRVARIMPGFGTARQNDAQLFAGAINSIGATQQPVGNITMPTTGVFSTPIAAGIVRVKIYNSTTAVTAVNLTLYDGTTAVTGNNEAVAGYVGSLPLTSATASSANVIIDFQSDLSVTSMVIGITGGTGGSADIDIGATSA